MNRREAIKKSSLSALALGTLPSLSFLVESCGIQEASYVPVNLTVDQYKVVWQIAETILPKTTTPGANEAGVAPYIDLLFSGYFTDEESEEFKTGLDEFATVSKEKLQLDFADATEQQKQQYLLDLDENAAPDDFYKSIKDIVLWAYFTSEVGIKSMDYKPVPGKYSGCTEVDINTKNLIGNRWS